MLIVTHQNGMTESRTIDHADYWALMEAFTISWISEHIACSEMRYFALLRQRAQMRRIIDSVI